MSAKSDFMRAKLVASTLVDAQPFIAKNIRRITVHRLWEYANRNRIMDFDSAFVTQSFRDQRDSIEAWGTARLTATSAATTLAELIVIFDDIAAYI